MIIQFPKIFLQSCGLFSALSPKNILPCKLDLVYQLVDGFENIVYFHFYLRKILIFTNQTWVSLCFRFSFWIIFQQVFQAPPTMRYTLQGSTIFSEKLFRSNTSNWVGFHTPKPTATNPQPENQPTGKDLELTCRRWIALEARGHHGAVGAGFSSGWIRPGRMWVAGSHVRPWDIDDKIMSRKRVI